jgi:hypothetical protein
MALSHHSDRECNAGKQLFTPTFERRVLVVLPRFSSILIRNRLSNMQYIRTKCDRSLPTCQKCSSRSLECPGYGLKFKWRAGLTSKERSKSVAVSPPSVTIESSCGLMQGSQTTSLETVESHSFLTISGGCGDGAGQVLDSNRKSLTTESYLQLSTFGSHNSSTCQLLYHYTQVLAPNSLGSTATRTHGYRPSSLCPWSRLHYSNLFLF